MLAAAWAAFTVAGLAAAPELMRHRVGAGDWVVALQPFPWLTGAALALAAAAGHWALVAAAVTGTVAVAMACTPTGPGPAASRIMGKLTL